ncbi:MAG: alpha/beta hydrolase [Gammaproteobacteria bacterium]|nr:alpha/beta hydrolase [Gammaproteobacteria bacterium]
MYVTINNTRLFFDVYGSKLDITAKTVNEKPTLIVLHGGHGFADHTLYVEFWSQFADISQVIFLDQRGCGRSDTSEPDKWNLQQWADDLHEFCITLNISNPIIAGVSMGGHVMCEYIDKHYDYPSGLIFCNTEAMFPLDIVCKKLKNLGGDIPAKACYDFFTNPTEENFAAYAKLCIPFYAKNAYSPQELNRCIKHLEVFLHYCKQQMLNFNYLDRIDKIQCPTLLLVSSDSLHVVEAATAMAEQIEPKYLNMELFENTGAPVYKDSPEKSYQIVKQFLEHL